MTIEFREVVNVALGPHFIQRRVGVIIWNWPHRFDLHVTYV
jgi:hypothetical protein